MQGKSFDAGVKGDFVDGKSVYQPIKGVTSKGMEAEVSGEIAPGWNLQAGYAHAHGRNARGERVHGATQMLSQRAQTLRLSSSYRLRGDWNALTLGARVAWQSATEGRVWHCVANDYASIRQTGYALVGLMARYRFSQQLSAALHISKLFDTRYYSGLGLFETGFHCEPRSASVTVRYQL